MVAFKTLDEIALAMIDFLRLVQPELDTKPGTVARDLFVDAPASEVAKLYSELRNIANVQSFATAVGTDIDRLARNYGLSRGGGSPASGSVYLTTNDLSTSNFIAAGSSVLSRNGAVYRTLSDVTLDSSKTNVYRANALRIRAELDIVGITDQFAVEVAVEATQNGETGNVGKFGISQHNIPGISNVLNVAAFTGGSSAESDTAFRSRVLSVFAGSNIGTALGYVNALLSDPRITDAVAVTPGEPLMIRDGTLVQTNDDGEEIVIASGTGGKVDLYIQGQAIESFSESFIYRDQSGRNDATDDSNDFVLGQRSINPLLDYQQKRKLLIDQGTLPFQPVQTVVSVSGSSSGPNFLEKFTDEDGNTKGSFELIKDSGVFGGSPFGFDKIHFISNQIELDDESISKGTTNGQDALDFTDVQSIDSVIQEVSVTNEHAIVDASDRSILTLLHTPVLTTTRVENLTTGERYIVANQNVDGGELNTTGRIKISGSTLPTSTDLLQVNYIWQHKFDENLDYDNLQDTTFTRTVQDSIDWGFSNRVEEEEQTVLYSGLDGYHVIVTHPISRLINVNTRIEESLPNVLGKITTSSNVENIFSILTADNEEAFNTAAGNGSFSGKEITLPTDTLLSLDGYGTVIYNLTDIYSPDGYDIGSFSGSLIKLSDGVATAGDTVYVDYVANITNFLPATALTALPAVGDGNEFIVSSAAVGNQPVTSLYDDDEITKNIHFAPSYLKISLQGLSAAGRLTIKGTSFTKVEQVFTIQRDGLEIDLSNAIKAELGVSTIPSSVFVGLVDSIQRVTVADDVVQNVDYTFDLLNYKLADTRYSANTALEDDTLAARTVKVSATETNLENSPVTGQQFKVVFYIVNTNEVENITVTTSGTRISKRKYVFVDRVSVNNGFVSLSNTVDGTILIDAFTQPVDGSAYFASYSYTAPKEGERIIVSYNYNRLVSDATFAIERVRPVTADVLTKEAPTVSINISMIVTVSTDSNLSRDTIVQNVKEALSSYVSSQGLDATIDASDLTTVAGSVDGVDAADLTKYNLSGLTGRRRSLSSGKNKYFVTDTVEVTIEER